MSVVGQIMNNGQIYTYKYTHMSDCVLVEVFVSLSFKRVCLRISHYSLYSRHREHSVFLIPASIVLERRWSLTSGAISKCNNEDISVFLCAPSELLNHAHTEGSYFSLKLQKCSTSFLQMFTSKVIHLKLLLLTTRKRLSDPSWTHLTWMDPSTEHCFIVSLRGDRPLCDPLRTGSPIRIPPPRSRWSRSSWRTRRLCKPRGRAAPPPGRRRERVDGRTVQRSAAVRLWTPPVVERDHKAEHTLQIVTRMGTR